ncbi:MAG: deoxynucleoside kinase [Alphaproteobacteria bacterium]|nr:deoxynucleoside kinase [Alphaproteobacteria bacterium]
MRQFIVVEGLIGVGKTSLCKLLAETWGARLVLEPSETNPFLEQFYEDPERFGFPVQMYYLVTRWKQQAAIRQEELFTRFVVSDYLFEKDRLFAEKTLPEMELELYDRFAAALGDKAPKPDLLIFLDAPIDTIMKRIAKRNAPGEHRIKAAYLTDLRERYKRLLADYDACPVLYLDNRDMDYLTDERVRHQLLEKIRAALAGEPPPTAPGSDPDREAQPSLFGSKE